MIKVGVIGAGFMGSTHAACYANMNEAELTAVADIRPDKVKELCDQFGATAYETPAALFEKAGVDMVDICLPTDMHCEFVVKAAEAGLNVICEKPMARNVEDAEKMIAATEKAGVTFMVAHVIRFWPEYMVFKELFDSKRLGEMLSMQLTRVSPRPNWAWGGWLGDPAKSGGAALDLHIHDADYVRYLLGDPEDVDAVGAYSGGGWDHIFVNYRYPNVAVAAVGGWDFPETYPFTMAFRAVFEKGAVSFDCNASPTLVVYPAEGEPEHPEVPQPQVSGAAGGGGGGNIEALGGYFNETQYFVQCLEKGEKPTVVTPQDARDSLALTLKEIESAAAKLKK